MRAAIRGDFERLEERRGEQVLLRPREHSELEARDLEGREPDLASATLQQTVTREDVAEKPKRSWIDRLLGL